MVHMKKMTVNDSILCDFDSQACFVLSFCLPCLCCFRQYYHL